jgi:hypothetical protein
VRGKTARGKDKAMVSAREFLARRPHAIPAVIAAAVLLGALYTWPYAYYVVLRLVVCAVAVFVAYKGWTFRHVWALWVFAFMTVLFNPIVPVHLTRHIWQVIDLLAAAVFVVAAVVFCRPTTMAPGNNRAWGAGFGWIFIPATLAVACFYYACDVSLEAASNQDGGNVPVYAGRRDPEVVDERWADADSYRWHLGTEAVISTVAGIALVVFTVKGFRELKAKRFEESA